jgi:hypothetical protein
MARLIAAGWLVSMSLLATTVIAQEAEAESESGPDADLTLPPQIDSEAAPGAARLEPAPEEREDMLEAVVTGGQTDFRLPDLGTSFRADDEEFDPTERIDVQFLYLFDPENEDPAVEAFPSLEERLGLTPTLKLFEVRVGGRDSN